MKKILNSFLHLVMRSYVITQKFEGVEHYYLGSNSRWTTDKKKAKKYRGKPNLEWMAYWHVVKRYYA